MIKYFTRDDLRIRGLCVEARIVCPGGTRVDINRGYVVEKEGDADIILLGRSEPVKLTRVL